MEIRLKPAFADLGRSTRHLPLVAMLAWQDVRQRYRRSMIGPFWLTLSMAIMIAIIQLVFGQIFRVPMQAFLPHVAIGLILWSFLLSTWTEGCQTFIASENIIKQLPLPLFVHVWRTVWRNCLVLAHNLVILPLLYLALMPTLGWQVLFSLPGLLLLCVNLTWMTLILAVLCTRYRDLSQIVASGLQVLFYLTPVMWMPSMLPEGASQLLLTWNPLYHWFDIVRGPLLGAALNPLSWWVSIATAAAGWLVGLALFARSRGRIAYWL